MDASLIQTVLNDENEIDQRIYVFPTSAVLEDGKKIGYFDFISSLKNEDCNRALARIADRIDMNQIDRLVEETPGITELQKDFYKVMLSERKEKILDYSIELLQEQKGTQEEWGNQIKVKQNSLM